MLGQCSVMKYVNHQLQCKCILAALGYRNGAIALIDEVCNCSHAL